jgi:hypothetical protein
MERRTELGNEGTRVEMVKSLELGFRYLKLRGSFLFSLLGDKTPLYETSAPPLTSEFTNISSRWQEKKEENSHEA